MTEIGAVKSTLLRSSAPLPLRNEALRIERELKALKEQLSGNARRNLYSDPGPVSIENRIFAALMGVYRSTYGPTPTHRRTLEIAEDEFAQLKTRLERIGDSDLPDLRRDLESLRIAEVQFADVESRLDKVIDNDLPALRAELNSHGVPWTPGRGVPAGD